MLEEDMKALIKI